MRLFAGSVDVGFIYLWVDALSSDGKVDVICVNVAHLVSLGPITLRTCACNNAQSPLSKALGKGVEHVSKYSASSLTFVSDGNGADTQDSFM